MTDKRPITGQPSSDVAAFAADTLLLDALGQGEAAPADDRVASLLASWRAELAADIGDLPDLSDFDPAVVPAAVPTAAEAGQVADLEAARAKRRGDWKSRSARRVLGAAAAVLVAGGGLVVGAGHATPGNPLWPLTRVMYPERADSVTAEQALAQARQAAAQGRHEDARRLLAQAEAAIGRLSDRGRAQQLRAELTTIRNALPAAGSNPSAPAVPAPGATSSNGAPGVVPPGGAPTPQPGGAPVPQPGTVPAPTVTSGSVPLLPPPPQLPVPLPSTVAVTPPRLPLPTLTNAPLPLPGGDVQLPAVPALPVLPGLPTAGH